MSLSIDTLKGRVDEFLDNNEAVHDFNRQYNNFAYIYMARTARLKLYLRLMILLRSFLKIINLTDVQFRCILMAFILRV